MSRLCHSAFVLIFYHLSADEQRRNNFADKTVEKIISAKNNMRNMANCKLLFADRKKNPSVAWQLVKTQKKRFKSLFSLITKFDYRQFSPPGIILFLQNIFPMSVHYRPHAHVNKREICIHQKPFSPADSNLSH